MNAHKGSPRERNLMPTAASDPGIIIGDPRFPHVGVRTARWIGAFAVLSAFCWLMIVLALAHHHRDWHASGRLGWSLTILAAAALITRGVFLGRPVTVADGGVATVIMFAGIGAHMMSWDLLGNCLLVGAALALMWPTTEGPQPDALPRVRALIDATASDPLAPFAMHSLKSYYFSADGTAAIAYRTRLGFAVVSGDPIGDARRFPDLVADFAAMCHGRGWRIIVLCCSQRRLTLWRNTAVVGQSMTAVPIGRDVVIDVDSFTLEGRRFRNLRQAVQRSDNFGISTEVVGEQDLDGRLQAELAEVLYSSHSGARTERGFSMILDGALEGRYPGVTLIIARDRSGQVQGFHRYLVAGSGSDVTLDVPWRRPGAPNGIDERLSVDMVEYCKEHGGQRVSLAFAAFPEIFDDKHRDPVRTVFYAMIHLGRVLIHLESLFRYLRKFHSFGERRYVLLSLQHLLPALVILLSLEFLPRRRHLHLSANARTMASA